MNRRVLVTTLVCIVATTFATAEPLIAFREKLDSWAVGRPPLNLKFESDEEGFWSPQGPILGPNGALYFVPTYSYQYLLKFADNRVTTLPFTEQWSFLSRGVATYRFSNQQGKTINGASLFELMKDSVRSTRFDHILSDLKESGTHQPGIYPTSWGYLVEFPRARIAYIVASGTSGKPQLIDMTLAPSWLAQRDNNLVVDAEGHLTYGGVAYTVTSPNTTGFERYLGRMISGHGVFSDRLGESSDQIIYITNARGDVELTLQLPWANTHSRTEIGSRFSYSMGNWGELSFLLAPPSKESQGYYSANPAYSAELAVVRNHLRYFGRLSDGGVRLRRDPSTSGEILGTYLAKTGFRIVEKGSTEETISGQKNFWYKVRLLDGKEGWFFGAFIKNLYDGPDGRSPPWPNSPDWQE